MNSSTIENVACGLVAIAAGLVMGAAVVLHLEPVEPAPAYRGPAWDFYLECDLWDDLCEETFGDIEGPIQDGPVQRQSFRGSYLVAPAPSAPPLRGHSGSVTKVHGRRFEQGS